MTELLAKYPVADLLVVNIDSLDQLIRPNHEEIRQMSAETHEGVHRHPAPTGFIRKYIFSIDHKVIGIQYIMLALAAVLVGMTMSLLMRLNLSWPGTSWPILETLFPTGAPGGVMTPEFYLSLVTMHGTIMVFFVLTTAPQGGFGNYFLPIQIGAEDMAFPVLNMLSFWVTLVGFIVILLAIFVEGNQRLANGFRAWTIIRRRQRHGWANRRLDRLRAAECARQDCRPGQGAGMNLWIISIAIFCVGSLLGALNFITTLLNMRTKGMSLMRMPLTCWAWFTTAVLALLVVPGAARRRHPAAARSHRGHQLLYSRRSLRQRLALRHESKLPAAHRRFADSLAAPVLVLRTPGSLHRDPARHGRDVAHPRDLRAQTGLWLSRDGVRDLRDRPARLLCVGPPHVHQRHEPLLRDRVFDVDAFDRRAFGGEDIQLAGHAVGRANSLHDRDVVCASVSFRCSWPAVSPD